MPGKPGRNRPDRRTGQFCKDRRGVAAVDFALTGFALFAFLLAILNLALLGFSMGGLARGVQAAARAAAVQAAATYAQTGTITCPSQSVIAGYFNRYADPPLPAATGATGNPVINAVWTDNGNGTMATEPQGVYLTLTATYKWVPTGFAAFGTGFRLSITTVAVVLGSAALSASC